MAKHQSLKWYRTTVLKLKKLVSNFSNLNLYIMKPIKEMIFRYVGGRFVNISGDSEILADVLHDLNLEIDEKCEFARLKDYSNNRTIIYRAFDGKISIQIWNIQ